MKNYRFSVAAIGMMVIFAACRKQDVKADIPPAPTQNARISSWNVAENWSNLKTDDLTTYFSKFSDSSVTTDVVNAGFVLVFKKNGNDIQSLPFQEKESKSYWYYQVAKGAIRINSDNNNGQNLSKQSFSYFVVTPQQLSMLEAKGKTKLELLQLSYEQAEVLLR